MSDETITLKTESLDRLTEHWIAEGAEQERDRIIKMLEALMQTRPTEETIRWGGFSIERVIELIKG